MLRGMLELAGSSTRLVLLNCCSLSSMGHEFVAAGVPHVVCCSCDLKDSAFIFQTDSGFLYNILHCSSRPARHIQNMFITCSARTRRPRCLCGISTAFCFRASPCSAASTRPSWRCGATPRDSCRRPRSTSGCCPKAKAPDLSPKTCRNCRHPQKILKRYALMVNTWSIVLSF